MFSRLLHINQVLSGNIENDPVAMLNQGLPNSYQYGVAICFSKNGTYHGIRLTKGNADVVYRSGPPNGFDPTAVSKFAGNANRVINRLLKSLKAFTDASICVNIAPEINAIIHEFDVDRISDDVEKKINTIDIKDQYPFVYIAFLEDNDITPLFALSEIKQFMVSYALQSYAKFKAIDLVGKNMICSVCGKRTERLVGNFSLIKCYNLDKRGTIVGGMDYPSSLNNFPICEMCLVGVSKGWDIVQTKLVFNIAGEQYLLLPYVRDIEFYKFVIDILKKQERGKTLKKEALQTITNSEKELLQELAVTFKYQDTLSLTMVFFESSNAAWRIAGEVNEILPSRIRKIYDIKSIIESDQTFTFKEKPFYFTLKILKQFTGTRHDKHNKKQFLKYIDVIFSGGQVESAVFLRDAVSVILNSYKREPGIAHIIVRDAWATYCFLNKLGVIQNQKGGEQMLNEEDDYGRFFQKHTDFFNCPEKKVSFLTGCYISTVLYVQRQHLGNDPFFRKLRGLKMDRNHLQNLYPEARNKLHQYNGLGLVSKTIDPQLAQSWIDCGNKWNISDDEATFAFTLGLALSWNIRNTSNTGDTN